MLASKRNGTLYTGVSNDLVRRVWEHKHGFVSGFTKRHRIHTLVWFETHDDIESAIHREKQLKKWRRDWKLKLIEENNPQWLDLYEGLTK